MYNIAMENPSRGLDLIVRKIKVKTLTVVLKYDSSFPSK